MTTSASSPSPFDPRTARTWAEIDLAQAERNAQAIQQIAARQDGETMAVVKADAYGHGAERIAAACARSGIAHYGVASVAEAIALRHAGLRHDIYTLSPFLPEEAEAIVRADLIPMVSSPAQWEALNRAAQDAPFPARCFLKVDTGMGRSGALPDTARVIWQQAQREAGNLRVTGIATHFSSADETDERGDAATQGQVSAFLDFLVSLGDSLTGSEDGRGGRGIWLSLANSPAALRVPFAPPPSLRGGVRGFLVRAGLLLYGIEPFQGAFEGIRDIQPVLAWRARVTLVRDMPAGATVGYGRTCTLTRPSRVATIAAGYADGLPRRLSNRGYVLLRGQRFPIIGRVSMDQCQVDVTDAHEPVTPGDIVTLIGTDGEESQTVPDIAEQIGTISHEVTCALTQRVPRIFIRRG